MELRFLRVAVATIFCIIRNGDYMEHNKRKRNHLIIGLLISSALLVGVALCMILPWINFGRSDSYEGPIEGYQDEFIYYKDSALYTYRPDAGSSLLVSTQKASNFCINQDQLYYINEKQLYTMNLETKATEILYTCDENSSINLFGPQNGIVKVLLFNGVINEDLYIYDNVIIYNVPGTSPNWQNNNLPDWDTLNQQYGEHQYDTWSSLSADLIAVIEQEQSTVTCARQAGEYVYIVVPFHRSDNLFCYKILYDSSKVVTGIELIEVLLPVKNSGQWVVNVIKALSFTTNAVFSFLLFGLILIAVIAGFAIQLYKRKYRH